VELIDERAALEGRIDALEADLAESLGMLELALEDGGWRRLTAQSQQEFSRDGLRIIAELCRILAIKNPLIRQGARVQRNYVFGQGVTATAAHPQVNEVLQAWWVDPKNQAAITGHQAMQARDKDLLTDGNLFLALFTNPTTGRVRVRCLPFDEIADIVTDPDDADTPRYYLRAWTATEMDPATNTPRVEMRKAYYPDWRYTPRSRPARFGGVEVLWDAPVYHVAPERVGRWGVSEIYAAIDWARAYKEFLEDWATFTRSLSRFAAKLTTPGGKKGVQAARARLASTYGATGGETNPPPAAGSTFIGSEGYSYDPVRIGGANVSMDDGRRLLLMVAAVFGLPETFFGDASVGSLATAKSLDRPTELQMLNRQKLHGDVLIDLAEYVVRKAATASKGPLRPLVRRVQRDFDPDDGTVVETVIWRDVPPPEGEEGAPAPLDASITISFPPVVERDVPERMGAIGQAQGLLPAGPERDRLIARLTLEALDVPEVDSVLTALMEQPTPEPVAPPAPAADAQGDEPAAEENPTTTTAADDDATDGGDDAQRPDDEPEQE
jgi:ribosomal protein L12E/L44/L45/RPP1/RPP2